MGRVVVCMAVAATGSFAVTGCGGTAAGYGAGQAFVCGGEEVFLIDLQRARANPAERIWSWKAEDSPQIALPNRGWFANMDDCKPVLAGSAVLVSSSGEGAIAIIRRADKACLFYAGGGNAHSAAIIDGRIVAGAFSLRTDQLRLYRLDEQPLAAKPAWSMDLRAAHGAVWDPARRVLWALGDRELLKLTVTAEPAPSAQVVTRWPLPSRGGHDLYAFDADSLSVSTGRATYRFDIAAEKFEPLAAVANLRDVKSLCRNPATGQILYTQGEPTFTNKVHVVGEDPIVLPSNKLYKARWNWPNAFEQPAK